MELDTKINYTEEAPRRFDTCIKVQQHFKKKYKTTKGFFFFIIFGNF